MPTESHTGRPLIFRCVGIQVNESALLFFKYSDRCFCISFGCFGNDSEVLHIAYIYTSTAYIAPVSSKLIILESNGNHIISIIPCSFVSGDTSQLNLIYFNFRGVSNMNDETGALPHTVAPQTTTRVPVGGHGRCKHLPRAGAV